MSDFEAAGFAAEKYREFVDLIEDRWSSLIAALSALTPEEINLPGTCGTWSVKDVIGHIAVWDAIAIETVHGILDGTSRDTLESTQEINDRTSAEHAQVPIENLRVTLLATHQRLINELNSAATSPVDVLERIEWAVSEDTWKHYDDHLEQIRSRFIRAD
jgi:hypothetical protein